jgi:hypothetical protein
MRSQPSGGALALGTALLVLAFAALVVFIPYLTRDRETVAGVPVPPPFAVQENIALAPNQEVCLDSVAIDVDSELVEFTVVNETKSGPPLRVTATAPGYRATAKLDGGYRAPFTGRVPLVPPPRSLLAALCVANRGTRKVELLGTHEPRTASRPVARVDGREVAPDLVLRFLSKNSGSVVERLTSLVGRMSAFRPPVLEAPVLWLILALLLLVLPAAAIYAVASSFRAED